MHEEEHNREFCALSTRVPFKIFLDIIDRFNNKENQVKGKKNKNRQGDETVHIAYWKFRIYAVFFAHDIFSQ